MLELKAAFFDIDTKGVCYTEYTLIARDGKLVWANPRFIGNSKDENLICFSSDISLHSLLKEKDVQYNKRMHIFYPAQIKFPKLWLAINVVSMTILCPLLLTSIILFLPFIFIKNVIKTKNHS